MKIRDFFEKGYYINLDRRPDRRESFEEEVKRVGLEGFFERVSAEDSINEKDPIKKHNYCGLSYKKLLSRIYEEGYERVLILEDDMYFYDGGETSGLELVERALDQIEQFPDWELLYFGGYPFGLINLVSENLGRCDAILTTHAIGYTRKGIEKVLPYEPFKDCAIDGWLGCRPEIIKYLVYPLAVPQTTSPSDLDAWGNSPGVLNFLARYKEVDKKKSY